MFAGTASGDLLHPYVIYKAEHLHDRWIQGGPVYSLLFHLVITQ